jgi:hypothetical protein
MARVRIGSLFGSELCVPSPGTVPRFSAETGYAAPSTGMVLGGLFLGTAGSARLLLLLGALLEFDGTSTELNLTAAPVLGGAFIVAALPRGGGAGNGPRDLGAEGPVPGVLTGALMGALGLVLNMAGELKVCGRVLLLTGVMVAVRVEVIEDGGVEPVVALIELGGVLLLTGLTGALLFLAVLNMSSK